MQLPAVATLDEAAALAATLDEWISPRKSPTYGFLVQLHLGGPVSVADVSFEHDIQTSALGLPELTVGENRAVYADDSAGERRVRITHRWLARTAWHPPEAPAAATGQPDPALLQQLMAQMQQANVIQKAGGKPALDAEGNVVGLS